MAPGHKTGGRTKNTPNSSGQSRPLAPAPAQTRHGARSRLSQPAPHRHRRPMDLTGSATSARSRHARRFKGFFGKERHGYEIRLKRTSAAGAREGIFGPRS